MLKILVVDDSECCRKPMARLLQAEGYEATCASNGLEALESLDADKPALIVLDMAMPVMDGVTFLTHLQHNPRWQSLPVIVVSGEQSGPLDKARELGVKEVFVKTKFNPTDLCASIRFYAHG